MINAADFFYQRGNLLADLLSILNKEELSTCKDPKHIRIYKFAIAVQLIQEEGVVYITKNGFNCTIILPIRVYDTLCKSVIMGYDMKDEQYIKNAIFLERAQNASSNWLYFQEYIKKEVNDEEFITQLEEFCNVQNQNAA